MAKAQITTPSGMSVQVEGTPTEIRAVVEDLESRQPKAPRTRKSSSEAKTRVNRVTLAGVLQSLRDDGFFDEPRDLGSIKAELDANGHFWPVTTLSGAVLAEVRKKNLRRLKQNARWSYVRVG